MQPAAAHEDVRFKEMEAKCREGQEEAKRLQGLVEHLEAENARLRAELAAKEVGFKMPEIPGRAEREAARRVEMCKRAVRKMLQQQLSLAWNDFHRSVQASKAARKRLLRVLSRLTNRRLAGAFDAMARWARAQSTQRKRVQRTMAKWRAPAALRALDQWKDFVAVSVQARSEELAQKALLSLIHI